MRLKTYQNKMKVHEAKFNALWAKIVTDTNDFIRTNPEVTMTDQSMYKIERFVDTLCLSGGWIHDRINKYSGLCHNDTYRKSITKKIRKVLGYNL